jgi:hypothetical protein
MQYFSFYLQTALTSDSATFQLPSLSNPRLRYFAVDCFIQHSTTPGVNYQSQGSAIMRYFGAPSIPIVGMLPGLVAVSGTTINAGLQIGCTSQQSFEGDLFIGAMKSFEIFVQATYNANVPVGATATYFFYVQMGIDVGVGGADILLKEGIAVKRSLKEGLNVNGIFPL